MRADIQTNDDVPPETHRLLLDLIMNFVLFVIQLNLYVKDTHTVYLLTL